MRIYFFCRIGLFKCIFIAFYFASHVVAQPSKFAIVVFSVSPTNFSKATDVFYPTGNYLIYGCGYSTKEIKALLAQVHHHLQKAIDSIESAGPSGTEAYNAFFRGVDPKIVTGVFRRIIAGSNILVNGQAQQPSIACLHPNNPVLRPHWNICEKSKMDAFHDESQYVFLCPSALRLPTYPHSRNCVRANTKFNVQKLVVNQFTILIHELVHLYLNRPNLKPEVYGVIRCLELPPEKSVANAANYHFYIASM